MDNQPPFVSGPDQVDCTTSGTEPTHSSVRVQVSDPDEPPVIPADVLPDFWRDDDGPVTRRSEPRSPFDTEPRAGRRSAAAADTADVVFSQAMKGGVGKTTFGIDMAQAAAAAGLRVVLIDACRGQGDVRTYLRLSEANVPTIYDAAIGRPIESVLLGSEEINRFRPSSAGSLAFSVVLAPQAKLADPERVTAELYRRVLRQARSQADLVVVDTQILEAVDVSGLVEGFVLPELIDGAWSVVVTDLNIAGAKNTQDRLRELFQAGARKERTFIVVNDYPESSATDLLAVVARLADDAREVKTVPHSESLWEGMNRGKPGGSDHLRAVAGQILAQVTGDERLDRALPTTRVGFFSRWEGRGK